jgi:UDP-2,3-diacylglucosamine pyrophosphatase LpxH
MNPEYVISDLHLGDGGPMDAFAPLERRFFRFVRDVVKDSPLKIVGDLAELWQFPVGAILRRYRTLLGALASRDVTLILGNHDEDLADAWPGRIVTGSMDVQGQKLFHGHQYDRWQGNLGWWITKAILPLGLAAQAWLTSKTVASRRTPIRDAWLEAGRPRWIHGHTHAAEVEDGRIDCGCWCGPAAHYAVIEDGRARLEAFEC